MVDLSAERDEITAGLLAEALEQWRRTSRLDWPSWKARAEKEGDLLSLLDMMCIVEQALGGDTTASTNTHTPAVQTLSPEEAQMVDQGPTPKMIGRYRIVERIGSGAMGTVYRAEDSRLRHTVAVKVPRFEGPAETRRLAQQRFLRKAQSAAQVRHASICTIYDVGESEGVPFVVMAYVAGGSLADRLAAGPRLEDCHEAAELIARVAEGLAAVHARGLIHRDVKPANILLDGEQPLLTDFGLARATHDSEHLTADGALVGTPAYMAPEQAAFEGSVGPLSDVYGLGVVLYHMLTGRVPFEGSPLVVIHKLTTQKPPCPSQFRPDLDPALEQVVLRTMAAKPEDRFASAREFAVALSRWARKDQPTHVPPIPTPVKQTKAARREAPPVPRRRRMVLAAALLGGLLLVGGLVTGTLMLWSGKKVQITTPEGEVVVTVPEKGVRVFVDDEEQDLKSGKTLTRKLKEGKHRLSVKREGKELYGVDFQVLAGKPIEITATWPQETEVVGSPSPLDKLRAEDIPQAERLAGRPSDLVKVIGTHAWHSWGGGWAGERMAGLVFDTDGKTVLVCTAIRNTVRVADAATGRELAAFRASRELDLLYGYSAKPCFSSDGRLAAIPCGSNNDWSWQIWDVYSRKKIRTLNGIGGAEPTSLLLSQDCKRLVTQCGGNGTAHVFDESGDKAVASFALGGHGLASCILAPDGKFLAWITQEDNQDKGPKVHVWNIDEKKERWKFAVPTPPLNSHMSFSPDGRYLALSGNPLMIWDLEKGKAHPTPEKDGKKIAAFRCVFSPDSKTMACDRTLWDVATGKPRCELEGPKAPYLYYYFAFSPDGKSLAAIGQDNAIRCWDTSTGKRKHPVTTPLHLCAVSPDGRKIAVLARGVDAWKRLVIMDLLDSKNDLVLTAPESQKFSEARFDDKGRKLAALLGTGCRVYDLSKNDADAYQSFAHQHADHLAFSLDGKKLVTSSFAAGNIKIWNVATKQEIRTVTTNKVYQTIPVGLSPDGKTLAYTTEKGVRVEDADTGKNGTIQDAPIAPINGHLRFSADGKQLGYSSAHFGKVWDWKSGKTLSYPSVLFSGQHFAFGPAGKTLFSGGVNGRIVQFAQKEERVWELPGVTTGLAATADGRYLFTNNANGTIYVLRLASPIEAMRTK